ncbi:hypothetical protein [Frankia sp. Cr2]|uniref:hypothetical protein n=1 Tax=Frankia sp. Cr2 TaxID=3073932 RepID=UPI002AD4379D|nr:hypothetical protein [Frankia sp. Cr2]
MTHAQPDQPTENPRHAAARREITECDQKLGRYRAALEAGADPTMVATWTTEIQARRTAAATLLAADPPRPHRRLTEEEIKTLITRFDDLRQALRDADPDDKAEIRAARERTVEVRGLGPGQT